MSSRDEEEVSGDEVFDLLGLPLELIQRVANCLGTRDAVNLAQTCRTLFVNLALTHLKPVRPVFTTFERMGDVTTGDRWYRAFRLPVLNRRVHSMRLECWWRDQGWGNRKGECCIVGYPSPSLQENSNNNSNSNSNSNTNDRVSDIPTFFEPPTTAAAAAAATGASKPFQGGRVVATSQGTAQHHEERLKMTFSPLENEIYHLWYKVGGGGGHVLYLRTGELHTVIFDDEYRNFSNNYRILFEEGILCREVVDEYPSHQQRLQQPQQQQQAQVPHLQGVFFPRMLISVSRALRWELQEGMDRNVVLRQRTSSEDQMEAFLAEYNIPLSLGSLVALEEIVQADIEERLIRRSEGILQQRLREQEEEQRQREEQRLREWIQQRRQEREEERQQRRREREEEREREWILRRERHREWILQGEQEREEQRQQKRILRRERERILRQEQEQILQQEREREEQRHRELILQREREEQRQQEEQRQHELILQRLQEREEQRQQEEQQQRERILQRLREREEQRQQAEQQQRERILQRQGVWHIPLGLMPRVVQMAGPHIIPRENDAEDLEWDPQDEEEGVGAEQEREEVQGDDNDNDGALALMDAEDEM